MSAPVKYAVHPFAAAIPEMLTDEFIELVADIKANGLKVPITIYQDQLLDGRHRDRACAESGTTPVYVEFTGTDAEARAFVTSVNVHRRHLSLAQKQAHVAAELKRDPGQTDNAIATKAKVSNKTVSAARARAVANREIPNKAVRVEASGRKARGAKPKALPTKAVAHAAAKGAKKEAAPPKPLALAKPSDAIAARILTDLAGIAKGDLSHPASFAEGLRDHARRIVGART